MTYSEAKKAANKENANIVYMGDAGNGCKFEVYFCPRRNRQIWAAITKDGTRIV